MRRKLITRRGLLYAAGLSAPVILPRLAPAQFGACLPGFCKGVAPPICGAVSSTDTWNPADKTAGMILSNGNKTVTSTNGGLGGVRTVGTHTTGKWYFELFVNTMTGNIFDSDGIGICTGAVPLASIPGNANSFWIREDGDMFLGPSGLLTINALAGQTVGFAIDLDAQLLWARSTGFGNSWTAGSYTSDPVTGLNGLDTSTVFGVGVAVYPCATGDATTTDVIDFNQTLTYAPPTGYCAW